MQVFSELFRFWPYPWERWDLGSFGLAFHTCVQKQRSIWWGKIGYCWRYSPWTLGNLWLWSKTFPVIDSLFLFQCFSFYFMCIIASRAECWCRISQGAYGILGSTSVINFRSKQVWFSVSAFLFVVSFILVVHSLHLVFGYFQDN